MKCIIIFAVLVSLSHQMTTIHYPDPYTISTYEPSVRHQYIFYYDNVTHKMIVHRDNNCYIFTLTDQERTDVHSDASLIALEIQFLTRISAGELYLVNRTTLEYSLRAACGFNIEHFYAVS